ncbi:MAG: hypothetical protein WDW38_000769 [Sanguina aurantia]
MPDSHTVTDHQTSDVSPSDQQPIDTEPHASNTQPTPYQPPQHQSPQPRQQSAVRHLPEQASQQQQRQQQLRLPQQQEQLSPGKAAQRGQMTRRDAVCYPGGLPQEMRDALHLSLRPPSRQAAQPGRPSCVSPALAAQLLGNESYLRELVRGLPGVDGNAACVHRAVRQVRGVNGV